MEETSITSVDETSESNEAETRRLVEPLIAEYLKEIQSPLSVAEYCSELTIAPIKIDGEIVGFWGLRFRVSGNRKLATAKGFYLKKSCRGSHLNQAADDFIRGLKRQGITELEIWAHPGVQRWLERRYGIKPVIQVTHNPLEVFEIFED